MKHLRYLLMAALVAMPLTACDEDDEPTLVEPIVGTVSGTVSVAGTGLAGIDVTLVGATSQSATTSSSGAYSFANVEAGSYGVTISNIPAGVSFANTSKTTAITTDGQTVTVDFTGSHIETSSITGTVTVAGQGINGVTVALTGTKTGSSVTANGGNFSFSGLRAGSYTVTISNIPTGYTFTTLSYAVTLGVGEAKSVAFVGQEPVTPPEPAKISINAITKGGAPINLSNVSGQIEISLNITRGDAELDRVEALIGDIVVASQTFAGGEQAAAEQQTTEVVVLNVPTNQVKQGQFAKIPVIFNGQNIVTAQLYEVGGNEPIPTNQVPVVMNNPDVLLPGAWTFVHAAGVTCALKPSTTIQYCTGGTVLSGYEYLAFGTVQPEEVYPDYDGSASCDTEYTAFGAGNTVTTGLVLTNASDCAGTEGDIYPDFDDGWDVYYPAGSEGPDGSELTEAAGFSRLGAPFTLSGENRWLIASSCYYNNGSSAPQVNGSSSCYDPDVTALYVDNKGPTVTLSNVAFNDSFTQYWVKGNYQFVQDVNSTDGGVTVKLEKAFQYLGTACTTTEWVTPDASSVAETLTSDVTNGYRICGYAEDYLGNKGWSGPSNYFGVDRTAPRVQIWGDNNFAALPAGTAPFGDAAGTTPVSATAEETIYGSVNMMVEDATLHWPGNRDATMAWGLDAIDDRAGLEQLAGWPFRQAIVRMNASGTTNATGEVTDMAVAALPNNWRRVSAGTPFLGALAGPGIFTYEGYVIDRAGNESTRLSFKWLVDEDNSTLPSASALVLGQLQYTPGQAGLFNLYGMDDLEVMSADLWFTYPVTGATTVNIMFGEKATAASRWDTTFENILNPEIMTASPIFGRVDFTNGDGTLPADFNTPVGDTDGDGSITNADLLPTSAASSILEDAGMNPDAAAPNYVTVDFIDYIYGGWSGTTPEPWTAADITTWEFAFDAVANQYEVEHTATTSIDEPYFDKVLLVINDGGNITVCAETTTYLFDDNGVNRFYTYVFAPPSTGPAACVTPEAGASFHGVGVKGAALLVTAQNYVPVVPPPPPAP